MSSVDRPTLVAISTIVGAFIKELRGYPLPVVEEWAKGAGNIARLSTTLHEYGQGKAEVVLSDRRTAKAAEAVLAIRQSIDMEVT